jgi:hypothetical protein
VPVQPPHRRHREAERDEALVGTGLGEQRLDEVGVGDRDAERRAEHGAMAGDQQEVLVVGVEERRRLGLALRQREQARHLLLRRAPGAAILERGGEARPADGVGAARDRDAAHAGAAQRADDVQVRQHTGARHGAMLVQRRGARARAS